jgi:hypothetical protein
MTSYNISVNGYYGSAALYVNQYRWWIGVILNLCDLLHLPRPRWVYDYPWMKTYRVPIEGGLPTLLREWGLDAPAHWHEEWLDGTDMWKEFGAPNPHHGRIYRTGGYDWES